MSVCRVTHWVSVKVSRFALDPPKPTALAGGLVPPNGIGSSSSTVWSVVCTAPSCKTSDAVPSAACAAHAVANFCLNSSLAITSTGPAPRVNHIARVPALADVTTPEPIPGFERSAVLTFGTVLDDGEAPGSDRAIEAEGHAAGIYVHYAAEHNMLDEMLPGIGRRWAAAYEAVPAERRHLEMHRGHLVSINEIDRPFISGDVLGAMNLAMDTGAWRKRLDAMEQAGATEIAYQPAGSNIPRELEAFAAAFHSR